MKAGMLFTDTGPIVILTRFSSLNDPVLLGRLGEKGIRKFVGFEIPENALQEQYGNHFTIVMDDLQQSDDLRILDEDGQHIFNKLSFQSLGNPVMIDG